MASLRQIRRRMKSIDSIHDITKAMEMIAAFRFKRSETRWSKSKNYFAEMERIAAHLFAAAAEKWPDDALATGAGPLFEKRELKRKTLVILTGDKGLCGAYNANLLRFAGRWAKENGPVESLFVPIGKVGHEFFRRKQMPVLRAYSEKATADRTLAKKCVEELKSDFLNKKTDSIDILYTSYRLGAGGQTKIEPFLSLNYLTDAAKEAAKKEKGFIDTIFEPDFETVFFTFMGRYLEEKIAVTLLESLTSEHCARMIAMKQAAENAEEVLDDLRLLRNKTRQATITRELSEIVGGASVLA